MLSVRLPEQMEIQLNDYCQAKQVSKTAVVQAALKSHFRTRAVSVSKPIDNPLRAWIGSGNGKFTTESLMQFTRGADWNQP